MTPDERQGVAAAVAVLLVLTVGVPLLSVLTERRTTK
jgi:hypothetical protein